MTAGEKTRLHIRLPAEQVDRLRQLADASGISMNAAISVLLAEALNDSEEN